MAHKKYVLSQPRKKAYKTSMFDCLLNDNRLLEVLKNLWNGRADTLQVIDIFTRFQAVLNAWDKE